MIELTERQMQIWRMYTKGLSSSDIAKALNVSRQFIHKTLRILESKIYNGLIGVAKANKVEIREIDIKKGFLRGYSPEFRTEVFVTFSVANGIQVWYRHPANCRTCSMREECRRMLREEAKERGITLESEEPGDMAEELFNKLRGG